MSYRPITDMWILARAKLKGGEKYYGAYLGGFPERARVLIGVPLNKPVLHVCGGKARLYPYKRGFGPNDKTLDIDQVLKPDYCCDAEVYIPMNGETPGAIEAYPWDGILIDPPYTPEDGKKYAAGSYPNPNRLVQNAINTVHIGGKVGIIHYILPACPKNSKFIACVGVICGFNNRIRVFSVFERES